MIFFRRILSLLVALWIGSSSAAIDINTADEAQLRTVKGLGEAKARAIVDYRNQHGRFRSLDDLARVPGFGARSVDAMRSDLTVGDRQADQSSQAPDRGQAKRQARGDPAERPR